MSLLPLMVDLYQQKIVIVGGGKVAERKIQKLLDHGGAVTVVSPDVTPKIKKLSDNSELVWQKKSFESDDVNGAFMVIAATDDSTVNRRVTESAEKTGLINNTDEPEAGNIQFPAHFERGKLSIAVSTQGASPFFAKQVKEFLADTFDARYEAYLNFLFTCRQTIQDAELDETAKRQILMDILDESLIDDFDKQNQTLKKLQSLRGGKR